MRFILCMGLRETRAAWKRLLFFFACIAIGVGAIVALRSVIQSVRQVLSGEARTLLAADVRVSTDRPWSERAETIIDRRLAEAAVDARTDTIEMATMVRPADEGRRVTRMVELRAIGPEFPLYGTIEMEDGRPYRFDALADYGVLVRPELLVQLGVAVGDRLVIGRQPFTIRGVVMREVGQPPGAFSLGSRVLIDRAAIEPTGLLTFGSRARRQILVRLDEGAIDDLVARLREDLRDEFVTVRSFRMTEDRIGDNLQRAENYLSLIGLVIVILGGIAVSSVMRVFVQQKIRAIAIIKCVGGTTRQILAIYLLQALALGLAGSLLGIVLAALGIRAVPPELMRVTRSPPRTRTATAVRRGMAMGSASPPL